MVKAMAARVNKFNLGLKPDARRAVLLNSELSDSEAARTVAAILAGEVALVLCTPEYWASHLRAIVVAATKRKKDPLTVALAVVDEVHAIMEWGMSFRQALLELHPKIDLPCVCMLCLSATVIPDDVSALSHQFGVSRDPDLTFEFRSTVVRNDVGLLVRIAGSRATDLIAHIAEQIVDAIKKQIRGMVFLGSKGGIDKVERLVRVALTVEEQHQFVWAHSNMSRGHNEEAMARFKDCRASLLLCTDVAAVGMNAPRVGFVRDVSRSSIYGAQQKGGRNRPGEGADVVVGQLYSLDYLAQSRPSWSETTYTDKQRRYLMWQYTHMMRSLSFRTCTREYWRAYMDGPTIPAPTGEDKALATVVCCPQCTGEAGEATFRDLCPTVLMILRAVELTHGQYSVWAIAQLLSRSTSKTTWTMFQSLGKRRYSGLRRVLGTLDSVAIQLVMIGLSEDVGGGLGQLLVGPIEPEARSDTTLRTLGAYDLTERGRHYLGENTAIVIAWEAWCANKRTKRPDAADGTGSVFTTSHITADYITRVRSQRPLRKRQTPKVKVTDLLEERAEQFEGGLLAVTADLERLCGVPLDPAAEVCPPSVAMELLARKPFTTDIAREDFLRLHDSAALDTFPAKLDLLLFHLNAARADMTQGTESRKEQKMRAAVGDYCYCCHKQHDDEKGDDSWFMCDHDDRRWAHKDCAENDCRACSWGESSVCFTCGEAVSDDENKVLECEDCQLVFHPDPKCLGNKNKQCPVCVWLN
jgi:hypothetical protein